MLSVIVAPLLGLWGIQYFLNKQWLKGTACILMTVACYFLELATESSWPSAIPFTVGLLSSVQLFGEKKGLSFSEALTSAPLPLQIYWGVMAVIIFFMPQIPFSEMHGYS